MPLKGPNYDFSLKTDHAYGVEEIWDASCRAASAELTDGRESNGLDWWREHGLATQPFPRAELVPVSDAGRAQGLRFELPYQERLLRVGTELGRRLHEHDMHWWDKQLAEYQALPPWKDFPAVWEQSVVTLGGRPADYPFWLLTARSMQYAWGGNVGMQLMKEVADNVAGHRGVIVNTQAAAEGWASPTATWSRSPRRSARCAGRAVLRQGIRPDTLLLIGQFDHWATPFAKDFGVPSLNTLATMLDGPDRRHRLRRRHRARAHREGSRMTRWAMVADLRRCVGCQTCTASCKHANATPPGVQWRRVLDMEMGEYPDVQRAFVPVGCQHCDDPPCMDVCPTTATRKRADGIVTIDYDLCIGCAYCAVACPYQARYKTERPTFAYGRAMANETKRRDDARLGVATKCTFCVERIDAGIAKGQTPGVDPEATPACVNACIAQALAFGDLDDPASNVSQLLAENQHFRMHEELGTGPGFYYLWDAADDVPAADDRDAREGRT